jgi:ubiquitin C-terminal hydrolase
MIGNTFRTWMFVMLPMILSLRLKRFELDQKVKKYQKLNSFYEFPEFLDLSQIAPKCQDPQYELASVVVHCGGMDLGHFTAIVRIDRQWFEFNDRQVRKVSRESVFDQNFGGTQCPTSAYFLIYVKQTEMKGIYQGTSSNHS